MSKRLPFLNAALPFVIAWNLLAAQDPGQPKGVKFISVGEITRISSHQKSFELKSETDGVTGEGTNANWPEGGGAGNGGGIGRGSGGIHGSVWVGGSIGRGGIASGGRRGGADGGRPGETTEPLPPLPGDGRPDGGVRTKISTTNQTVFKDGDRPIGFGELRVGDIVRVTGVLRGKDIEAKEIVRSEADR